MYVNPQSADQIKHPIPPLPSFNVVAVLFSYFLYAGQEQDFLHCISKATREYANSHHIVHLTTLLKVHRFAPFYNWPNVNELKMKDVSTTKRSLSRSISVLQ